MSRGPSSADPPALVGQQLLAEFIQYGRQRPFEEIVRRYAGMVFNTCYRVTKDKHDAEDATQAVFLTLAVQAKRGAEIKALGPWLQQVAKRLSLDARRGKKRRKTREERHHDDQARRRTDIDDAAVPPPDLDELKVILHEELDKLPAKYRMPLILHYFGGMTREEMAAELNCKPSTLGVRIFRGREMLAGRLNGRGVHLSAGAMALAIGYLVRGTVSAAMVARTSHAATALASGAGDLATVGQLLASHDGSAAAAARVIALTRRASHVLVIGKVRVTVVIALLAGTSLGAGVRAFAMLPPIGMREVRQLISAGVDRLVGRLVEPLGRPLRSDAATPPVVGPSRATPLAAVTPPALARVAGPPVASSASPLTPPLATAPSGAGITPVPATAVGVAPAVAAARSADGPGMTGVAAAPAAAPNDHLPSPIAPTGASSDPESSASHRAADLTGYRAATLPLLASNPAPTGGDAPLAGGGAMTASAANDLYVPAAGGAGSPVYYLGGAADTSASAASAASQVQILQIPAVGGSVTESNGVVRGYGTIDRTGTLSVSGKVVADGDGVDRTLNLTSFSNVTVAPASSTSAAAATGWYAADHGRLSLALVPALTTTATAAAAATPTVQAVGPVAATASVPVAASTAAVAPAPAAPAATVLTWGADPSEAVLMPVNSARLTVYGSVIPTALSLLSPDRSDAPAVPAADGAPVGIWEIDPTTTPLSAVDILVRYDDHLVDELGGNEADVQLWTMATPADGWQSADGPSFSLDTTDHIVGGSATDVSYFAVTVPPAAGVDVADLIAHPAAQLAPAPLSTQVVPEPATLALLATAVGAAWGRRPRRRRRR